MMKMKNRASIETVDGKINRAEMKLIVRGEEKRKEKRTV